MAGKGRQGANSVLATHLAAGLTVRDAAKLAGVAEKTAYRRSVNPQFRRLVDRIRSGLVRAAAGRLADRMAAATDVLNSLLADPDAGVKLRAASKILELGLKAAEVVDLESRVNELEKAGTARASGGNE